MSTCTQSPKIRHLDDEHVGSTFSDAHKYAENLGLALEDLEDAVIKVEYQRASDAFGRALKQASGCIDLIQDNVGFMVDAVKDLDDSYEDPEEQHKDAVDTVARMSAFAELLASSAYAHHTTKQQMVADPEAIDEVRFSKRLSRELYEASTEIECKKWDTAWERLQGSMAGHAVLRDAIEAEDTRYSESFLADLMFDEINRVETFIHTKQRAQS